MLAEGSRNHDSLEDQCNGAGRTDVDVDFASATVLGAERYLG
jgi:hypothetical protein